MSQKNGKDTKDIPFYERKNAYLKCGLMSLVGSVLMLAAAFLGWMVVFSKMDEFKLTSVTFLGVVREGLSSFIVRNAEGKILEVHPTLRGIIPVFFFVIYLASVIFLGVCGYMDNIAKKDFFPKWRKRIRLGAALLSLLMVILMVHSPFYKIGMNHLIEMQGMWQGIVDSNIANDHAGYRGMFSKMLAGPGMFCYIVGIVMSVGAIAYNFVLDTLNEAE